jgi:hypothetical protein
LLKSSRAAARALVAGVSSELSGLPGLDALQGRLTPSMGRLGGRGPVVVNLARSPGDGPSWWPGGRPPAGAAAVAPREIHNHFTINEVGDGEATANRVLTRLAFAGGF